MQKMWVLSLKQKTATRYCRAIMKEDFSKHRGCTSITANIISLIQQATHILSVMLSVIILTDLSRMQEVNFDPGGGWTSHHSIVEFNGEWYLFITTAALSKVQGITHLRSTKATKLELYDENGLIKKQSIHTMISKHGYDDLS